MRIKSFIAVPIGFVMAMALMIFAAVMVQPANVSAHGDEDHSKDQAATTAAVPEAAKVYSYTAQLGDSYSKLARKAAQTYGLTNKVNLSGAQIIFAETNLTNEATSPTLSLGEKVTIPVATVKSWVENAQKLTDTQKANWNYYVQFVDFNTNKVGEAR